MSAEPHREGNYIWLGSVSESITELLEGGLLPGVRHVSERVMSEGERKNTVHSSDIQPISEAPAASQTPCMRVTW